MQLNARVFYRTHKNTIVLKDKDYYNFNSTGQHISTHKTEGERRFQRRTVCGCQGCISICICCTQTFRLHLHCAPSVTQSNQRNQGRKKTNVKKSTVFILITKSIRLTVFPRQMVNHKGWNITITNQLSSSHLSPLTLTARVYTFYDTCGHYGSRDFTRSSCLCLCLHVGRSVDDVKIEGKNFRCLVFLPSSWRWHNYFQLTWQ